MDVSPESRILIDLFLLGRKCKEESLPGRIRLLLEELTEAGVLIRNEAGEVATPGLSLVPVLGLYLFCHTPRANPLFYFGDDSVALLTRLRPRVGGTCLDLCTGPGLQALHAAGFARKVMAVDIKPAVAALAKLNSAINGVSGKVEVKQGNLFEAVGNEQFDYISANPPLLPFPEKSDYPFVGHGGEDGMRVTWRILEGLPRHLADDGCAHLIGTCLSDGILPLCLDSLESVAMKKHLRITMTVVSHTELTCGSDYFKGLVETSAHSMGTDAEEVSSAFKESLERQHATHLCAYFLHCSRNEGSLRLHDMSRENSGNLWYV